MRDHFALLDEKRRPWIDPEALKTKFLSLSAHCHPDRVHAQGMKAQQDANRKYAELNAAYQCLSNTRKRLQHLIELESGSLPQNIQRIPPGTMEYFLEVGQLCNQIDRFLSDRDRATSPLLKVQFFEKAMDWTDKINALRQKLTCISRALEDELKSLNPDWDEAASPAHSKFPPMDRLEQVYRTMSFLSRWESQLQEKSVLLSL